MHLHALCLNGLIFSENNSLPIDSSWMAFKIPATIKGKKLFFFLFFKSTINPSLFMNTVLSTQSYDLFS